MTRPEAPRWRSVLLALVGFLFLPVLPTALRSVVPITETWMLLAAAVAMCAALGWWNGGGVWPAVAAIAFGLVAIAAPLPGVAAGYATLVRGWTLLLAAAFGVASLLTPNQGFFPRALVAVGIATAAAFAVAIASPEGIGTVHDTMQAQFTRRTESTVAWLEGNSSSPEWRQMAERNPAMNRMVATSEATLRALPARAASMVPAVLALESLAALVLAWALYHRLAGVPLGPPLGELRQFRFNDQLVWGLAVGATIALLPVFADGRMAGVNLLVFFGTLYLLRGVGVLSWMARAKWVAVLLIVLTVFGFTIVGALALGVGVADTWMDWRSRPQSAT